MNGECKGSPIYLVLLMQYRLALLYPIARCIGEGWFDIPYDILIKLLCAIPSLR